MALITTYSDANKVESTGLVTTYTLERDAAVLASGVVRSAWWKVTRRRTKNYRYVGMTKAAAAACVTAKIAQYLRTFQPWNYANGQWKRATSTGTAYQALVADVVPEHEDGPVWSVTITLDESVVVFLYAGAELIEGVPSGITDLPLAVDTASGSGSWEYDE